LHARTTTTTTMTMQTGTMTGTSTTSSRKFLSEPPAGLVVVGRTTLWLSRRVVYSAPLYCTVTSYVQCYNHTRRNRTILSMFTILWLQHVWHGRPHLRSSSRCRTLAVPRTRTCYGHRSFAAAGPDRACRTPYWLIYKTGDQPWTV